MAVPFASSYAPINTLNAAIMAQDQLAQQAELQRRQMDNQGVNEAMNRIIQARAIEQQGRNQQQHYGLQQQQLANDLAYRNAALQQGGLARAEQARQFDAQFGLNKQLTEAQLKNPFFGAGKDFAAYGLQAGQDAAAHNAAATAIASQATGALSAAREAYKAKVAQIKDPSWYESVWRHLPVPTATQQDLLNSAKADFDATFSKLLTDLGPHRDKVEFVGTPEENGVFKPVLLSPPSMPGMQRGGTSSSSEALNVAPSMLFSGFQPRAGGGAPEIRPDAAAPVATVNPFTAFLQRQLYGNSSPIRTNVPPAVVTAPGAPNRIFRYDPNAGLVPLQ